MTPTRITPIAEDQPERLGGCQDDWQAAPLAPMLEVSSSSWKIIIHANGSIELPAGMTPSEALLITAVTLSGHDLTPGNPLAAQVVQKWMKGGDARADAPELVALVEALKQCRDELDAYSRQEYPSDHPVHARYRQRDYDANPARIALANMKGDEK